MLFYTCAPALIPRDAEKGEFEKALCFGNGRLRFRENQPNVFLINSILNHLKYY